MNVWVLEPFSLGFLTNFRNCYGNISGSPWALELSTFSHFLFGVHVVVVSQQAVNLNDREDASF